MTTNLATNGESASPVEPSAYASFGADQQKPDDHLTSDSVVAPPDQFESPFERPITAARPRDYTSGWGDEDFFNERAAPKTDSDLGQPEGHLDRSQPLSSKANAGGNDSESTWMLIFALGLTAWAGIYMGMYSGGFRGDVFTAEANYRPSNAPAVDPASPEIMAVAGQKVYAANCAQCHQASGLGQGNQFPPLVGSEWVIGDSPNRLAQILLHGMQGPVHVKGQVYNNNMPAWGKTLNDKQIAQVLTYIRTKLGDNKAGPISAAGIGAERQSSESRSEPWTEAELLALAGRPLAEAPPSKGGQ